MSAYNVGDRITQSPFGGGSRTGVVTAKHADVKNGRPGFDMILADGEIVWGYDSQILMIGRSR